MTSSTRTAATEAIATHGDSPSDPVPFGDYTGNAEYAVDTDAELRAVIGSPNASTHRKLLPRLDDYAKAFIAQAPLLFVATADDAFNLDVSPKGDAPGFVGIAGDSTLFIPERPGNRLAMGFQNILRTGKISLLFAIPGVNESLRVQGRATLTHDPAILTAMAVSNKPALLCTVVSVEECFFHCGKAFLRSKAWQPADRSAGSATDLMVQQFSQGTGLPASEYREKLREDYQSNLW